MALFIFTKFYRIFRQIYILPIFYRKSPKNDLCQFLD